MAPHDIAGLGLLIPNRHWNRRKILFDAGSRPDSDFGKGNAMG
jgi:hypothetical protein